MDRALVYKAAQQVKSNKSAKANCIQYEARGGVNTRKPFSTPRIAHSPQQNNAVKYKIRWNHWCFKPCFVHVDDSDIQPKCHRLAISDAQTWQNVPAKSSLAARDSAAAQTSGDPINQQFSWWERYQCTSTVTKQLTYHCNKCIMKNGSLGLVACSRMHITHPRSHTAVTTHHTSHSTRNLGLCGLRGSVVIEMLLQVQASIGQACRIGTQ